MGEPGRSLLQYSMGHSPRSFRWMQNVSKQWILARHNRALMVMAVAWAKEQILLDQNVKWY